MRQVIFTDHDFDVDPEVVRRAQNLNDPAHSALVIFRIFEQFDVDDHAIEFFRLGDGHGLGTDAVDRRGRRRNGQVFGNLDPVLQALVVRDHEQTAAVNVKLANHGGMRALQNLDDLAVGTPAALDPRDAHYRTVAMHGVARRIGRNVDIARDAFEQPVGDQKAVAVAMHGEAADGEFAAAARGDEMAAAGFDEIAASHQARQHGLEILTAGDA